MDLRKNQACLTPAEKKAFVNAVLGLKKKPSKLEKNPTPSRYDDYVQIHMDAMNSMDPANQYPGWAHQGPAFLPWHRYFLRQFELDLQAIDPTVTLPYWDWTVDNSKESSIWNCDFMGPNGQPSDGRVVDGPFAAGKWKLNIHESGPMADPNDPEDDDLKRMFGTDPDFSILPTDVQVADALTVVPYYVAPWRAVVDMNSRINRVQPSFCNRLEGWYGEGSIHNRVHVWVGGCINCNKENQRVGTMQRMTSLNDPVFFLHHCNIDRLWALWQQAHPTEPYLPINGGPKGHNLNDPMMPWGESDTSITPSSVLNHWALGYRYDTDKPPLEQMLNLPHIELMNLSRSLDFKDVPETDDSGNKVTRYLDIPFKVNAFIPVTLKVVSDPPAGFGILNDVRSIIVFPRVCDPSSTGRLWVSYTSTTAGSKISGSMTIQAVESGQKWTVNLSANTAAIIKPKEIAAITEVRRPRRVLFGISPEDKAALERGQQ